MSLLELIARKSHADPPSFSLPNLLAEQALARVPQCQGSAHSLITRHFATELLREGPDGARSYVDTLIQNGVTRSRLLREYIPAVAEFLGGCWSDDILPFTEVTHGMGNLMQVTREITAHPPATLHTRPHSPRMLLVRTPGEDHVLGLMILAWELRSQGWLVNVDFSGNDQQIREALGTTAYDVIGLSAAGIERAGAVRRILCMARRMQPRAQTAFGGYYLVADAFEGDGIDADILLYPGEDAVQKLEGLFRLTED